MSTRTGRLAIEDGHGTTLAHFVIGVGTVSTPTPAGLGYLQARYRDLSQGQSEYPST